MVSYTSPIDPHAHLRGEEYEEDFRRMAYEDLFAVGAVGVCEQPNTIPALTTALRIEGRAWVAEILGRNGEISYRGHIAFTPNFAQQNHALSAILNDDFNLIGADKIFYARSTSSGEIEITNPEIQRRAWVNKARTGYKGVSMGHFEDEELFVGKFDYKNPVSHSLMRPPWSELIQVERQLGFAYDAGFEGVFYIAHVSNPDTVDLVMKERSRLPFEVVMEITPHHMMLNWEDYEFHQRRHENGNLVKMNPPLRDKEMQEKLLNYVLKGKFDVIGTDHAPHPFERKSGVAPASGIPGIPFIPKMIEILFENGWSREEQKRMMFDTSNRLFFGGKLKPLEVDIEYNPELWAKYGFNPFERIDGTR